MKKRLIVLFAFLAVFMCFGTLKAHAEDEGDNWIHYKGIATAKVNVRTGPGEEYDKVVMADKTNLQLDPQEEIIILDEAVATSGKVWFHISVVRNGVEYQGYSTSSYVSKKDGEEPITPSPTPEPTPTPTPKPTATPVPTSEAPVATQPLIPEDNTPRNDSSGVMKAILVVVIVAVVLLIGLMVMKLLGSRGASGTSTSHKLDILKKLRLEGASSNNGRKLPQIKKSDADRPISDEVRSDIYYRNTYDDDRNGGMNASMQAESEEKKALREAIERLQEHDIVYHTIYGEGEVYDNSDVKLIEVRFGNDMRFLKKEQLVAKRELKIIDEEDQSIARRRNRRRNNKR